MALVTYDAAVNHLLLPAGGSPVDPDLDSKIEQASAMVLTYLDQVVPSPPWTVDTDPALDPSFVLVQAAVLHVLANLWRFRGDDENAPDPIDPHVKQILSLLRPPIYA